MAKPKRSILGDDPFAPSVKEEKAPVGVKPEAKKAAAKKAATKKAATKKTATKKTATKKRVAKRPGTEPTEKKAVKKPARRAPKVKEVAVAESQVPPGLAAALEAEIAEARVADPVVEVEAGQVVIPAGDLGVDEAVEKVETEAEDGAPETLVEVRETPRQPKVSMPPPLPAETASEYGPSIDRPTALGLRGRAVEAVRHVEDRLRAMMLNHPAEESRKTPPLELVWKRWRALAMRDRSDVVDEFGRDPNVAAQLDPVLDFLYRSWFRVTTTGVENVPASGRGLIVANHSGSLPYDAGMLMHAVRRDHATGREVRPLVEDFVFHFPYLGTLVNRIGGVRACQENAERLLRTDQLVAVFPEGVKGIGKLFSQRYQLQRFGRGGFIKLALSTDSPIIPAAVVGAEEIHPMLAKVTWLSKALGIPYLPITPTFPWLGPVGLLPLPAKWFIAFGQPLDFAAEYGPQAAHDRILVNRLAEQVRHRIQEMIDQLVKARRSVLFG